MDHDADHMRRAISLARAQLGRTADNPAVGCVIVRDDVVVGEGATGDGGRPHAEEIALDRASDAARGAVAFVTLEPCAQRSSGAPSCSERLVDAGVARVVVACPDPSVFAAGRGAERLRASGVPCDQGLLAAEAEPLYAGYAPAKSLEMRR
ncbi:MAG: bifunctional diaminohydroxyphosphoribosylaminopyrimidine deaminase/5-amino-6-(5-phosphoribosylamino)uracil reductase RibD [Pseudomonadota bacterium]